MKQGLKIFLICVGLGLLVGFILIITYMMGYNDAITEAYNNISNDFNDNYICVEKIKEVTLNVFAPSN